MKKAENCTSYEMFHDKRLLVDTLRKAGFAGIAAGVEKEERHCTRCATNGRFTCPADTIPGLRKRGCYYFGDDGDSGIYYWIFEKGTTDAVIKEYLNSVDIDLDGTQDRGTPMYDCTGDFFAGKVQISRRGSRVLVTQHWGIDV